MKSDKILAIEKKIQDLRDEIGLLEIQQEIDDSGIKVGDTYVDDKGTQIIISGFRFSPAFGVSMACGAMSAEGEVPIHQIKSSFKLIEQQ